MKFIDSNNEVNLTAQVKEVRKESIQGHTLLHVKAETLTRFERLSGRIVDEITTHELNIWQLHVNKPVETIQPECIIRVKAELKNQPWVNPQTGRWYSKLSLFVYDFEILTEDGNLTVQQSRAIKYPERT